jgi:predicted acylesterase/phospholipase RssA
LIPPGLIESGAPAAQSRANAFRREAQVAQGIADAPVDSEIDRIEAQRIVERRKMWKLPGGPNLGLALSGGGIRSATFSLGVLRELSALGKLPRFDYLSTVSGGAYVGAFFGGLFVRRSQQPEPVIKPDPRDHDPLGSEDGQAAVRLLRQSGRYLAPSGIVDYWYALTIVIRNWLGVQLVLGSILFGAALLGIWMRFFWELVGAPSLKFGGLVFGPLIFPALLLVGIVIGYGWAYWLTWRDVGGGPIKGAVAVIASILFVLACWMMRGLGPLPLVVAAIGAFGLAVWLVALIRTSKVEGWWRLGARPCAALEEIWDTQRVWISRRQSSYLRVAAALGLFALVDALAHEAASWIEKFGNLLLGGPAAAAILVPAGRWLVARAASFETIQRTFSRLSAKLLIPLVAILLTAALIGFWEVLAYWLTWPFTGMADARIAGLARWDIWTLQLMQELAQPLLIATLLTAIITIGVAPTVSFLNLSSLATFYAGRLRRAYLGAGNPARLDRQCAVDKSEDGDDIQLGEYYPATSNGAPLHLISVTLNQTRGKGSTIVERDRHGRNMTLGPAGISVSLDDGSRSLIRYDPDGREENLPLSTWVGISGASFSTGMGERTGFGFTTLAGLANVRLGYWWRAGLGERDHVVQRYLLDEFRGRFSGTGTRRWYLSDGGHFDNSAIYELIRRRLPFILASDNGQDDRYIYDDIATLMRKARIDFDAEISFLDQDALDARIGKDTKTRRAFGSLAQVAGQEPAAPHAVAALATIAYADKTQGTLVLIKPRLTDDGPADLIRYKLDHEDFPQQSTLDQFFDEAQWESYYTLGRFITRLVMQPSDGKWSPGAMKPLAKSNAGS